MSRGSISHSYEYIAACSQIPTLPSRFSLTVRQQPVQTRQSTTNERDRRPVDPPPIVQIKLEDAIPQEIQKYSCTKRDFLQNPYFFMCASLAHPVRDEPVHEANGVSGQAVSSMYKLKDYDNHDGGFFVFGDLSIRIEGQYRIKFTLFEITLQGAVSLKSIYSDVFSVYSSKTFPGMLESTFLSRSFSDQGVRLRIRKEHRVQMNGSRKRKASLAHDDDSPTELTSSSSSSLSSTASWYWPTTQQQQQQQQLKQQHAYPPANKASRRLSMDLPWPASSQPTRRSWSFSVQRDEPVRLPPIRNIMSPPPPSTTPSSSIATPTQPPPPIQQSQQPPPPPQPMHPTTVANGTPSANGAGDIIEVDAAVAMMQLASPQHSMVHLSSTTPHHHHHHHQRIQKHSAVW